MTYPKRYRRRRPRHPHKSPFLRLPREIRDMIYRAALISPTPIDLCPANYAESNPDGILDISPQRYLKFVNLPDKRINRILTLSIPPNPPPLFGPRPPAEVPRQALLAFRLQNDLHYVRKGLATQLLQVCCQIYNEAADYYWGSNIWRFSDDIGWEVLWRFLLSIGVQARSRIRKLDVLAPFTLAKNHALSRWENWYIKNEPKLHMSKLWQGRRPRECYDLIYDMWMSEKPSQILNFAVPAGYCLQSPNTPGLSWNRALFMGLLPNKIRVIVESKGTAYDSQQILGQGWDLTALPGSRLPKRNDERFYDMVPVIEVAQTWKSEDDHLAGVSRLFELEETCASVDWERSHVPGAFAQVGRYLKGFGPCMIIMGRRLCNCYPWDSPCIHGAMSGLQHYSLVDTDIAGIDRYLPFD